MNANIHISFDLDGTLIDSIPLMKDSWENANKLLNLKVGWEQYRANIGLHFDEICSNLNLEFAKEEIKQTYFEYNKNNIKKIQLMPGVSTLLQELSEQHISWSILTSKPRYTAEDIIQHFGFQPAAMICSDDVKIGKPHPESADLLQKRLLHQKFEDTYYVGDTVIDHIFALNSGFQFIQFQQQTQAMLDSEKTDALILNPRPIIHSMDVLLTTISS
ncbi:MAG: HAD family hydrolase [Methylophaga sp.]|nr:HAD family hydrolase [Methylophaga sp.]